MTEDDDAPRDSKSQNQKRSLFLHPVVSSRLVSSSCSIQRLHTPNGERQPSWRPLRLQPRGSPLPCQIANLPPLLCSAVVVALTASLSRKTQRSWNLSRKMSTQPPNSVRYVVARRLRSSPPIPTHPRCPLLAARQSTRAAQQKVYWLACYYWLCFTCFDFHSLFLSFCLFCPRCITVYMFLLYSKVSNQSLT